MAFPGGSLVSSILQKSSALDQRLVESGAQKLSKKVGQLKEEMYEHVRQRYVEFETHVQTTCQLREKLREVEGEYRRLNADIGGELRRKIADSAEKRREIEDSLRDVQEKMEFVRRLASVHEELQASQRNLDEGDWVEAAQKLHDVAVCLGELSEMGCEARVFNALQEETALVNSEADLTLVEEWDQRVNWSPESATKDPPYHVILQTKLSIPSSYTLDIEGDGRSLADVVGACRALDTWAGVQLEFSNKLLHLIVKPLVTIPALGVACQVQSARSCIILSITEAEEEEEEKEGSERISELYANLATVFKVVGQVVPVEKEGWTGEVGRLVLPEMTQLITDHLLKKYVPKTLEELERYEEVKVATCEFEAGLAELGFAEAGFSGLSDFTQNIEVYFEEQKRQELLANARSILMKSIHDTEKVVTPERSEIGNASPWSEGEKGGGGREKWTPQLEPGTKIPTVADLMLHEDKLRDVGAHFPECAVSRCILEYVALLHDLLEASYSKETEEEKMDMFRTVRDLIDLYRAVFPTHHSGDIATIPAAAATYYNNCMYLVHHLIVESAKLSRNLSPRASFVDLILIVRRMGEDTFQQEMRKQRESVLRSLKTVGDFGGVSNDDKRDEVYRGVRQGLFQITQLSRVYKNTLPVHVHRDAAGNLLDVLVSYMIQGVLSLEDIVSKDSSELSRLLGVIVEKGPSVMQMSEEEAKKELHHHCPSWLQLQDLAFVLDARLQEIVDRWAGGEGTLGKNFKALQIRTLIKALFTNTDRRAAALDKITMQKK